MLLFFLNHGHFDSTSPPVQVVTSESPDAKPPQRPAPAHAQRRTMTSSPDTPESSSVTPDSFSGASIPGLPGHLIVAHVLDKIPDPTDLAPLSAVSRGMRAAVAETKREVKKPSGYEEAAKKGYLRYLKHMHSRNRLWDTRLLCTAAAASGQLEGLKALRAENFPWDWRTCACAAMGGHLELLKWARENECPWNKETCANAADRGHLDVLQWARENGCPWNWETRDYAAELGYVES